MTDYFKMLANQNNRNQESGLVLEGMIFILFFIITTFGIYFVVTRKLDQSHSYRQAHYDFDRGSFNTELPILIFSSAGYPELRPVSEVIEVLNAAQKSSTLHSLIKLPFCAGVVEAKLQQLNGQVNYQVLPEYQVDCNQFINAIPACIEQKLAEFLKTSGKDTNYFVMGFYVEAGKPFNDQCALARAVAHEVEPPVVFEPSYFEQPSPSVTIPPSLEPSFSPSILPTIGPSFTPSTVSSAEPSMEPSIIESPMPSFLPSFFPSLLEPSTRPSEIVSLVPTTDPSLLPVPTPSIFVNSSLLPVPMPCVLPTAHFANAPKPLPLTNQIVSTQ